MCLSMDIIKLSKADFARAASIVNYMIMRHLATDHVLVETDRYSRRELTRYGISFSYPNQDSRWHSC
jgi:hypothetical protein